MTTVGPMMMRALARVEAASPEDQGLLVAAMSTEDGGHLPAVVQLEPEAPREGEAWPEYAERMRHRLEPLRRRLETELERPVEPLLAANSLQVQLQPEEVEQVADAVEAAEIELDPLLHATLMDDAVQDVRLPLFLQGHPGVDGSGVKVAVLDSGIDRHHPYLHVADEVSTCGEPVDRPGDHGTHCAGSIASRDSLYPGIASGVDLLNVKVLLADGRGQQSFITRGVDAALDLGAQVLSMSLGFNHLPHWSANGHGWNCPDGRCPLCVAVDNAVALDGVVAVVAAGNEHERADVLRGLGLGNSFDTELGCPGQARRAMTVGAVTKQSFLPAAFSSRGATAYGLDKPDIVAPGVNVTSTVPVPRDAQGQPLPNPPRALLFDRMSGTSMATPIVAGAVALLIQLYQQQGTPFTPSRVRQDLLAGVIALPFPVHEVGAGLLDTSSF